jgi:hypothetical protein
LYKFNLSWLVPSVFILLSSTLLAGCGTSKNHTIHANRQQMEQNKPDQATSSPYSLVVDSTTGLWKVTGNNQTWTSNPLDLKPGKQQSAIEQNMLSPFIVSYWDGANVQQTNPVTAKAEFQVRSTGGTTIVDYKFQKPIALDISFELQTTSEGLEIAIPGSRLIEHGDTKLVSVSIAPFLDAALPKDNGYLLVPDGSGALIKFRSDHPKATEDYHAEVYGRDPSLTVSSKPQPQEQPIAPIFGAAHDGKAFLGLVRDGGSQTVIHAAPAGFQSPYYRTWPEIMYRSMDYITLPKNGFLNGSLGIVGPMANSFDARISYQFFVGNQANYVGMAQAFRDYLMHHDGLAKQNDAGFPLYLQVLGGVQQQGALFKAYKTLTTFGQVEAMVQQFQSAGISQLDLSLMGWEPNGGYATSPAGMSPSSPLGGTTGLKQLIQFMADNKMTFRLEKDLLQAYSEKGISISKEGLFAINRDNTKVTNWNKVTMRPEGDSWSIVSPEWIEQRVLPKFTSTLHDLSANGLYLRSYGNLLPSDFDRSHFTSREQMEQVYQDSLKTIKQDFKHVAVDYGNLYTLPYVDHVFQFPLEHSNYSFEDESVPFFPIALHGLITYSGVPGNLRNEQTKSFLRMVEYGAVPQYTLWENDVDLMRTRYEEIYSGLRSIWLDKAVNEYKLVDSEMGKLTNKFIIDHRAYENSDEIFITTYEDGTEVIVNYGEQQANVHGTDIPAGGFRVVNGGRKGS